MKVNFQMLDHPILIEHPTVLAIEEVKLFSKVVEQLYSYDEASELKLFDRSYNSLKPTEIVLITDVIGYEINSRPLLNSVHQSIIDQLNETPQQKNHLEHLIHQLMVYLDELLIDSELDLMAYETNLKEVLKLFNVSVNTSGHSINDHFYDIVQVVKCLKKKKLLVFVNSLSYLTLDEIHRLFDYISCYRVHTLFLEPRKINDIEQYVIDKEYYIYRRTK